MGIIQRIFNRAGYIDKAGVADMLKSLGASTDALGFLLGGSSGKISAKKALALLEGWSYACVRAISEDLAGMKLRLYRTKGDKVDEVKDHELLDLLEGVNPHLTGYDLRYLTGTHLEATGNAYWLLTKGGEVVKSEKEKPDGIYPLNPSDVEVLRGLIPNPIIGYRFREGAVSRDFKPWQLLHVKYPNPVDPYVGVGPLQAIGDWAEADKAAMDFNLAYFKNGARIGGFLESSVARTTEMLDFLRRSFEQIYGGVNNAHKVAVLPTGTTFKEAQGGMKDMDFPNLSTMLRDKILAGFRVPRTALGITDDVNRANAEATNYVFALRTIKPKMTLLANALNERLVPIFGDDLFLGFDDPVPENRELDIAEMTAATGSQPVASINEARERYLGLGPIENGDSVRGDLMRIPIGSPKPQPAAGGKAGTKDVPAVKTRGARNAAKRKALADEIQEKTAERLAPLLEALKTAGVKAFPEITEEQADGLWQAKQVRIDPYEKKIISGLRDINEKWAAEAAAKVGSLKSAKKAINIDEIFDKNKWVKATVDVLAPVSLDLFLKEGAEAAQLIGAGDIDLLTPEVRQAIEDATELVAESYNSTTADLLRAKLEEGVAANLTVNELKDTIRGIEEYSSETRALAVARTETTRISNDAKVAAWQASGVVTGKKWYTAADERVCPLCAPMNGKIVSLDKNFFDLGDTHEGVDGSEIDIDYDDVKAAPLHVNCRCDILPVVINS